MPDLRFFLPAPFALLTVSFWIAAQARLAGEEAAGGKGEWELSGGLSFGLVRGNADSVSHGIQALAERTRAGDEIRLAVDHESLPIRARAAMKVAAARRGLATRTVRCYCRWVALYATFAGTEREMMRDETASRFLQAIIQDNARAYTTQKQALNAVLFYFRHVCGLDDPVLELLPKRPKAAKSPRKS